MKNRKKKTVPGTLEYLRRMREEEVAESEKFGKSAKLEKFEKLRKIIEDSKS